MVEMKKTKIIAENGINCNFSSICDFDWFLAKSLELSFLQNTPKQLLKIRACTDKYI